MGEVYRARDPRLGRDVAIKVLPEAFARDPERAARFEREARVLGSLNHPGIAAIYGFEEAEGTRFLVMELVEGQTLRGPVELEDAMGMAKQICEALEAAHEKGIVHRDLKPANIKMTPEGKVKVLDFGLASLGDGGQGSGAEGQTESALLTRTGVILGTAAYMSPEQARGRPVDRRTDIWAFGCVLYELLTGKQAFPADTVSDAIAGILAREPDWSALPPATPERVRELLRRCLQKELTRRLRHIDDARLELEEPSAPLPAPPPAPPRWRRVLPWAVAAAAVAVVGWSLRPAPPPEPRPVMRFTLDLPAGGRVDAVALSRDGARLALAHSRGTGSDQIYLRALDQLEAKPLAAAAGGRQPFFSPDGQWLGFIAGGKLKKAPVAGGSAITLCDAGAFALPAVWGPDDHIIFTTGGAAGLSQALSRVPAAGGAPQVLTTLDTAKGESTHRPSDVLPGARAVLFTLGTGGAGSAGPPTSQNSHVAILDRKTGRRRTLVPGAIGGAYVPTGHLIYFQGQSVFAAPFDLDRLEISGPAAPVLEGVGTNRGLNAELAFSDRGTLVYLPGSQEALIRQLAWVDRKGTVQPLPAPPRLYSFVALSPDGLRAAVIAHTNRGVGSDLWMYDLARGTLTRLTFDAGALSPVWTPDGKQVTFSGLAAEGKRFIGLVAADGSSAAQQFPTGGANWLPESWSPDGKVLALAAITTNRRNIGILPKPAGSDELKLRPFVQSQFNVMRAKFSPDGRSIAYQSNESGRSEIYVQPYPGPGGKWQISADGGTHPKWARDGRELFYWNGDKLLAVEVSRGPVFQAGTPKVLFEGRFATPRGPSGDLVYYDVAPNAQRFLITRPGAVAADTPRAQVIVDWFDELRRRVPTGIRR